MNDKNLEKLINKLNNYKNIRFEVVDKILTSIGYECNKKNGGSHRIYRKKGDFQPINIPRKDPVKAIYINSVIEAYEIYKNTKD